MQTRFRFLLLVAALLLSAVPASAQTTSALAWDYDVAPAEVATYTQTVSIDNVAVPGAPSCVAVTGVSNKTTCTVPIAQLTAGQHTLSITAARSGQTAETRMTGLNPANGPKNAGNPRLTVTVIVTVP